MQTRHALLLIRTVTGKTVIGEDGPNLPVKHNGRWSRVQIISGKRENNEGQTGETQIEISSFSEYIVNQ